MAPPPCREPDRVSNPDPLPTSPSGLSQTNAASTAEVMINFLVGATGGNQENTNPRRHLRPGDRLDRAAVYAASRLGRQRRHVRTLRMMPTRSHRQAVRPRRAGAQARESGFVMVVALGVLTVTSLLVAAVYVGVQARSRRRRAPRTSSRPTTRRGPASRPSSISSTRTPTTGRPVRTTTRRRRSRFPGTRPAWMYSYVPVYNPATATRTARPAPRSRRWSIRTAGRCGWSSPATPGTPIRPAAFRRYRDAGRQLPQAQPARLPLVHRPRDGGPSAEQRVRR